eukprot:TRINITY_DN4537_c0_g1_i2.p2 TRINITY_DN4537_c0_g1~~TRINITY_DN4537_c0_g1_i2.p2  ORF type:complete len:130 (-),score=1.27 TRINITY_DN4537_c0_g1_i2:2-391(-)
MSGTFSTSGRLRTVAYARHTSGRTLGGMLCDGSGLACFLPIEITRLVSKIVSPASPRNISPPNVDDILGYAAPRAAAAPPPPPGGPLPQLRRGAPGGASTSSRLSPAAGNRRLGVCNENNEIPIKYRKV